MELGRCGYEKGSDGLMIHYMTDPLIVSQAVMDDGWTVKSLLIKIATHHPRIHALIDTGALITGMSNLDVARFLLAYGLPWADGVVFLDEFDRKMILVRATGRVLKLAQCGISVKRRFAFYDQVHTTGMDIQHVLNAKAVLTLGKDMTFRDYAQGAFRMRGIGRGQTIHLFVIPEVDRLIDRELLAAKMPPTGASGVRKRLEDIAAWLIINSMKSERVQYNTLCLQNVANTWRKNGYAALVHTFDKFLEDGASKEPFLRRSLDLFKEPIDSSLEAGVPKPRLFSETIRSRAQKNSEFVDGTGELIVKQVLNAVVGLTEEATAEEEVVVYNAEMVQEQEEEKEQQQEQEIEIEKYVDLAYSRENEEPTPWPFASLRALEGASQPKSFTCTSANRWLLPTTSMCLTITLIAAGQVLAASRMSWCLWSGFHLWPA